MFSTINRRPLIVNSFPKRCRTLVTTTTPPFLVCRITDVTGFLSGRRFVRTISTKTKKRLYICPNSVAESERYTGGTRVKYGRVLRERLMAVVFFYPRVYFSRLPLSNRVRTNFCARQRRVRIAARINGVPRANVSIRGGPLKNYGRFRRPNPGRGRCRIAKMGLRGVRRVCVCVGVWFEGKKVIGKHL